MLIKDFIKKYVPPQDTDSLVKTGIVFVLGWVKLTKPDGTKVSITDMPVPENLVTLMEKVTEAGFYENLSEQLNTVVGQILTKLNEVESGQILTENTTQQA
jgi:hypothetical protein